MLYKNKIENITLEKKGITLTYKELPQREILYSELDEIYITINKTEPFFKLIIILTSLCIAAFSYLILQTNIILILALLMVISIVVKMNTHKSYGLKIILKNRDVFEKKINAKSKHETIDIINDIRKEIYNYKIKKSNEELLQFSV
jgi:hypothetical protein